jgi:integrase
MGRSGKWSKKDVREIESLILSQNADRRVKAGQLSILYEATRLWRASTRIQVPFPHFLRPEGTVNNPFVHDYASAELTCEAWKRRLSEWIDRLSGEGSDPEKRDLRVATVLISAILHAGVLGAPYLVALVRAIPYWKQRTFIVGRVHIELSLARKGVMDAEQRILLPDALTAACWGNLSSTDADELLAPVWWNGKMIAPSDGPVLRRIGHLINRFRKEQEEEPLARLEELRRCARAVALAEGCESVFVAYNNAEFQSDSLRRCDVVRLFPGAQLLEFEKPPEEDLSGTKKNGTGNVAAPQEPTWTGRLLSAAQSKSPYKRLTALTSDPAVPVALQLVAQFGCALGKSSLRPGKRISAREVAKEVITIARSLGTILDVQDLAALGPVERHAAYLDRINQQPVSARPETVQAIRDFDLFLVARSTDTLPIQRNRLPYFPKERSVDVNLVTHREFFEILGRLEKEWPAKRDQRSREMARLLLILAFRAPLRCGELRGLRCEDLLILVKGSELLRVLFREEDPLKTPNAKRPIPIGSLLSHQNKNNPLSPDEMEELSAWLKRRIEEGAKAADYLFATPDGKRLPKTFFEDLNKFLRKVTPYTNAGKGIHTHHFRHAATNWLFLALTFFDSPRRNSLFPGIPELHQWLRGAAAALHQQVYGRPTASRKDPFNTARICGHASFVETTAPSYIHIFPWLVAHVLDGIQSMQPDSGLVCKASEAAPSTSKHWLREGGVHNIAVRMLINQGARVRTGIHSQPAKPEALVGQHQISDDWIDPVFRDLLRRRRGEPVPDGTSESKDMFKRADRLKASEIRHPQEKWGAHAAIGAPLKPTDARNSRTLKLQNLVAELDDESLVSDAVAIFADHHERDGFIQFSTIAEVGRANRYIEFLLKLGFGKRELTLLSGDTDPKSKCRRKWSDRNDGLSEPYLYILPCPPGRNYGPKTSLWIRPNPNALSKRDTGPAGFRFVMAMAYIVFGPVPSLPQ